MKLTEAWLRDQVDEVTWQRGVGYHDEGRVHDIVRDGDTVAAAVEGEASYRVRLSLLDDRLVARCSCPVGRGGAFCKHCVAVGLALIADDATSGTTKKRRVFATLDRYDREIKRIREHLAGKDPAGLIDLIVEQAMEDDRLLNRLRIDALTAAVEVDGKAVRSQITAATRTRGFIDYRKAGSFAKGIEQVVSGLAVLLKRGSATDAIPLLEYALRRVERAIEHMDDSDGYMRPILNDLQSLHHAACVEAKPHPIRLARRLFEWAMIGEWEVFLDAGRSYADVLGESGMDEYRRLAEAAWAEIPALGPGADRRLPKSNRFRITHIMESLALQSGDVDNLIEVKQRDLSCAYQFLQIAKICRGAGRAEQALDWAEQGIAAFPHDTDPRLLAFLADAYRELGREDDALRVVWQNFATHSANLRSYQQLKAQAERMGAWSTWRERALSELRASRRRGKGPRHRADWRTGAVGWRSSLVAALLWEDDSDAAWEEARTTGCAIDQWLALARRREGGHPDDAVQIYQDYVAYLVRETNNASYTEAVEIVLTIRELMRTTKDEGGFSDYLAELRQRFRAKRNFMKLLADI